MGFYLGNALDGSGRIDYASKHLTTHGLIFGMTGSGKTGLALGLIEEAARAGIPVIAIDPKGDLGNLALSWPDLSPLHFAKWLDPAKLDGKNPLDVAESTANLWRDGLAADGLTGADIQALRDRSAVTVYTPGSSAGVPVSVLDRFAPPPGYGDLPEEDQSELVGGVAAALLALVNINADPLQSKEYILLANILSSAWAHGQALDLATLIQRVSEPPFSRLGVVELDEFIPVKRRRDFALQLNGLLASPSFQAWMQGEPLDIDKLFSISPAGVRTSIFSIAHLDDTQRMSFVTLLLDRVVAWMRAQPGTGALRALLYMDEVFGYLPPHPANPATKRPLLTLLKQARAFGLGVVLSTQNPVDIDYKALTNAGTWLVGKLQTDQDKERILDGLMGAHAGEGAVSRSEVSRRISALEGRQFLMQNAHDPVQRTFKSRFCMSYLRGPLTRQEITRLKADGFYNAPAVAALGPRVPPPTAPPVAPSIAPPSAPSLAPQAPTAPSFDSGVRLAPKKPMPEWPPPPPPSPWSPAPQALPLDLPVRALPLQLLARADVVQALGWARLPARTALGGGSLLPALLSEATVVVTVDGVGENAQLTTQLAFPIAQSPDALTWRSVDGLFTITSLPTEPPEGFVPDGLPTWLLSSADRDRARRRLVDTLAGAEAAYVPVCPSLREVGLPGESLDAFRARIGARMAQATQKLTAKADFSRDAQAASFDKRLAEEKQMMEMDLNEIKHLQSIADFEGLARAKDRARFRMERFKELQATRDKFVGDAAWEAADIAFAAIDHVAACELRPGRVDRRKIVVHTLALLWVPTSL